MNKYNIEVGDSIKLLSEFKVISVKDEGIALEEENFRWAEINQRIDDGIWELIKANPTPWNGAYSVPLPGSAIQSGGVSIEGHKIQGVEQNVEFADRYFPQTKCSPEWRTYQGFTDVYEYCAKCDKKKSEH